jgi:hypothetical protein
MAAGVFVVARRSFYFTYEPIPVKLLIAIDTPALVIGAMTQMPLSSWFRIQRETESYVLQLVGSFRLDSVVASGSLLVQTMEQSCRWCKHRTQRRRWYLVAAAPESQDRSPGVPFASAKFRIVRRCRIIEPMLGGTEKYGDFRRRLYR